MLTVRNERVTMEKNTELAYETLDHIRDHPEEWNQRTYLCGTTACFAGRAALIWLGMADESQFRDWRKRTPGDRFFLSSGQVARRALGWTQEEADHVFSCFSEDFAVLEQRVKEVLNGEICSRTENVS